MPRGRSAIALLAALALVACGCQRDPIDAGAGAGAGSPAGEPAGGPTDSFAAERQAMVAALAQTLLRDAAELSPSARRVIDAMRRVPRHEFVPAPRRGQAYDARSPLAIAENQTISSPEIVAIMTDAARLERDDRVLEIGTGSGYQAAVLGELVDEVYSVEIRPNLAEAARRLLQSLREQGQLGFRRIDVIVGNGYEGHAAAAPYDAIIVTAAPREVPVALLNQLAPGGRMVIPVGDFYQKLQVIERHTDGTLAERIIETVRFVPMVESE